MIIEKATKSRFIKMLEAREIIVINCDKSARRKTYDFKFIGANSYGVWDFTPLCAEISGYPYNTAATRSRLSIRSNDGIAVLYEVTEKLSEEGFYFSDKKEHDLYEVIRHLVTTFYI